MFLENSFQNFNIHFVSNPIWPSVVLWHQLLQKRWIRCGSSTKYKGILLRVNQIQVSLLLQHYQNIWFLYPFVYHIAYCNLKHRIMYWLTHKLCSSQCAPLSLKKNLQKKYQSKLRYSRACGCYQDFLVPIC
jgi:hypothetical protein